LTNSVLAFPRPWRERVGVRGSQKEKSEVVANCDHLNGPEELEEEVEGVRASREIACVGVLSSHQYLSLLIVEYSPMCIMISGKPWNLRTHSSTEEVAMPTNLNTSQFHEDFSSPLTVVVKTTG
jgi:hypothetical protein